MTNHPNRASRAGPMASTVKAAREAAGLTPEQAGALVHERGRRWTDFESGQARMHPAAWELFCLKLSKADTGPLPLSCGRPVILDYRDPRPGETWYDRDTGCAVVVGEVVEGIVYARGVRSTVETLAANWHDNYQRDPVAV